MQPQPTNKFITTLYLSPEDSPIQVAERLILKNGGRLSNFNEIDTLNMPMVDLKPEEEKAWMAVQYLVETHGYTVYNHRYERHFYYFIAVVIICIIVAIIIKSY